MVASGTPQDFQLANSRYELRRQLGKGGAGAVFLALDRETGEEVALKQLSRVDQRSIQRFKREFRALSNLHHRNLVKLYDFHSTDDAWFLTMEYVDGSDMQTAFAQARDMRSTAANTNASRQPDAARVSSIVGMFQQLALGVQAVHQAGMLHRDLKPSNVVIAKTGRIVVLDFGLVRRLDSGGISVTRDGAVAGTPAYMAPEQAMDGELTPAADWYAFGVMLYESLSGGLPIEDHTALALVRRKLSTDPQPLSARHAPPGLGQLCTELLQRDPQKRPGFDAIMKVFAPLTVTPPVYETLTEELTYQTESTAPTARAELFGREIELEQLRAAFDSVRENRSAFAHVLGLSGSGKSALIEHFLDELQDSPSLRTGAPLVLRGRCYEREAMPFKALDGVIDALVSGLRTLEELEQAYLLPPEIRALTQVFPAFERLEAVQALMYRERALRGDASQIRRNAERALRHLFVRVAATRSVVIWIDDLQWGDLDSASMLQDWLEHPAEAPILILLSYRSDEVETSSCLRLLVPSVPDPSNVSPRFALSLSPLGDAYIERLTEQRLGASPSARSMIARIVAEAQGNPFLAQQLAALAQAKLDRGEVELNALSVQELVLRTSALLPEPARALLRVLAIAGRPLAPQLALGAAGVKREGRAQIHALQSLRLVRSRIVEGGRLIEVSHDRVREAICASLSAEESRQVHERILRAVESTGQSEPAWLHALALGAGQRVLALRYGQLAAQIASSSLAFERAAQLYASCLTLTDERQDQAVLWGKLGLALARCRRGAEAADAYLKASEYADETERVGLIQAAASHLLRSGRYEEGERLVQRVMQALQIEIPSTRTGMFTAIAWERTRYALYALTVKPELDKPVPMEEQRRAEFCGMLAVWTAIYAPLRAALFQARTVRLAFQSGEATRMARALAMTATVECLSGTEAAAHRVDGQLTRAEKLADRSSHPTVHVELLAARAACAYLLGRPRAVLDSASQVDELYAKQNAFDNTVDYYQMFGIRTFRVGALQGLGRHKEANPALQELIAHARATDNVTTILQVTSLVSIMEQVLDAYAGARQRLEWERARLPSGEFGLLHAQHLIAVMRSAALMRDFEWGTTVSDELWPLFERSLIRRSAYISYAVHTTMARFVLNRHVELKVPEDPAPSVRKFIDLLSRSAPEPMRKPATTRFRARLAHLRGDKTQAAELFQESIALLEQLGVADDAARDRYALACVTNGSDANERKRAAVDVLSNCGIVNPGADLRVSYPEFFKTPAA